MYDYHNCCINCCTKHKKVSLSQHLQLFINNFIFFLHSFNEWKVGVGSVNISELEWQTTAIGFLHQDYNHMSLANNIGIIRLFRAYDSTLIVPIALPNADVVTPRENEYGTISGFGWTTSGGSFADILQLAHQRVVTQTVCNVLYHHLADSLADLFCAYDETSSGSMCGGDQGSAYSLTVRGVETVVGLASTTRYPSCAETVPNLYTRVSSYIPWIRFVAGM